MNAKQAYRETYRLYRVLAVYNRLDMKSRTLIDTINRQHKAAPKVAAAAHTSFSMRALFNH